MRAYLEFMQINRSFICKKKKKKSAEMEWIDNQCLLSTYVKVGEKHHWDLLVCDGEKE